MCFVSGWMLDEASPAPEHDGLAPDKHRAECALNAAPIPGIENNAQKKYYRVVRLQGAWEGLFFSCAHSMCYPVLAGQLGFDRLIASCVQILSDRTKMLGLPFGFKYSYV